ncbi:hypothetical protein BDP27DRAFT_1357387 [Rhodocollybia butyracea]|uniref:Uncharacterized protein n=1 Tax=Rhodocollybia butyracea TaxID=206335 RepID=A0A9P5Q840_9AGAR|nr:hypothetical protein BDP27DRAFT_1357387 [Rhodocollybia butyracea]
MSKVFQRSSTGIVFYVRWTMQLHSFSTSERKNKVGNARPSRGRPFVTPTNDQVYELITGRQSVGYNKDLDVMGAAQVCRITPDAVAKLVQYPDQHEAFTMQYAAEHASIPIPHIREVVDREDSSPLDLHWIVIDFISGQTLIHCWPTLSIWRKLCTMCTLWWYIHPAKSVALPNPDIPGPFDVNDVHVRNIKLDDNDRVWLFNWSTGNTRALSKIAGNLGLIYPHYWKGFSNILKDVVELVYSGQTTRIQGEEMGAVAGTEAGAAWKFREVYKLINRDEVKASMAVTPIDASTPSSRVELIALTEAQIMNDMMEGLVQGGTK